jgi:hypothetical protein
MLNVLVVEVVEVRVKRLRPGQTREAVPVEVVVQYLKNFILPQICHPRNLLTLGLEALGL